MIFRFRAQRLFLYILFFTLPYLGLSQTILTGINSLWDDSASEWSIYGVDTLENDIEGSFRIKWILRNDFSEWIADYNNVFMSIKMKFGNETQWELRSDSGIIIDMKAKWRGDITEWTLRASDQAYTWKSEYKNDLNLWFFEDEQNGWMEMSTYNFNDTRDWSITDESYVSDELKMACIFITLYHTTPKQ